MTMKPFTLLGAAGRLLRHRWQDQRVHRVLPDDALRRLKEHIARSELRHSGQIRICVEGGLPWSYLRRHAPCRERALMMFSKLRIWDTEHNNGVLVYLLIAERGLNRHRCAIGALKDKIRAGGIRNQTFGEEQFEQGLADVVAEVSALLIQYFPASNDAGQGNELPDEPYIP